MKKSILLLLAALCAAMTAAAQDLIVRRDAARIEAKVTEITPETVRYKRFSNPDGPTYVLPVTDIEYIRYANGEQEFFEVPETPATAPAAPTTTVPSVPAQPVAPVQSAASTEAAPEPTPAPEYIVKQYEIGDLYDRDGVRGIVCRLSEDRTHGLVLSLDEICLPWSGFRKPDLRTAGTDDRSDGMRNMETTARYIAENALTWDDFPAFKWCRDKGEGWYLPAIDELLTIGHNYNGGTRMSSNRQARNRFNDSLKENGGKKLDRLMYYFSSTEADEKSALTSHMGIEPPYVIEIPKYNRFFVRAVHKF